MSEILSEGSEMSSAAEASTLLRVVAGPREASDKIKSLIRRAARRLHWSPSRTKDVWYQDARRIDATEMDQLRDVAVQVEIETTKQRLLAMRNGLAATDPQFHRETIDALERALRGMGCEVDALGLRQDRRPLTNKHHKLSRQYRSA